MKTPEMGTTNPKKDLVEEPAVSPELCLLKPEEIRIQEVWSKFIKAEGYDIVKSALIAARIQKAANMRRMYIQSVAEHAVAAAGETLISTSAIVGAAFHFAPELHYYHPIVAFAGALLILVLFLCVEIRMVNAWWKEFSEGNAVLAVNKFYQKLTWQLPFLGIVFYLLGTLALSTLLGVEIGLEMIVPLGSALALSAAGNALYCMRLSIAAELPVWLPHLRAISVEEQEEVERIRATNPIVQRLTQYIDMRDTSVYLVYVVAQFMWGAFVSSVALWELVFINETWIRLLVAGTFSAGFLVVALSHLMRLWNLGIQGKNSEVRELRRIAEFGGQNWPAEHELSQPDVRASSGKQS